MRLQFEKIEPGPGNSFKVVHLTEAETCRVYWHYHPEYEIVYIPEGSGKRHVGTNISQYEAGELVFIGPNLPHLNFSYGKQGQYEEVVVQMRDDFLGKGFLLTPEMTEIRRLFERSRLGLVFGPATKRAVGETLLQLPHLPSFARMMTLLQVLHQLAVAPDVQPLHADGIRFDLNPKEQERINRVYQYVADHYGGELSVQQVADTAGLTVPAFCRYFKRMTSMTFTDFVNEYRVNQARRLLNSARTVADIGYAVGFSNLSHFNKTFKVVTGQTPSAYRRALAPV
ncbi:helix-turn-helix domain-containing protein [Rudanella paleaurantiibacter]|uniref:Helix-turn-helix domain-containing protein n=1 Tax=Rudanella paleaurantiibacter TaxID=2614655 RepID=A0A7J5TZM4_9BACT|nr:AraC family transcriptional regulator [Rudanella paleaurantiibacter]KAB7730926.1 helix-turn-helix domain-containing protein [Rudanella paleaurantiibacter]